MFLLELKIEFAQLAERAVGADFGGAGGAFEDGGDLDEGEFLKPAQEQDFAVVTVEAGERRVE